MKSFLFFLLVIAFCIVSTPASTKNLPYKKTHYSISLGTPDVSLHEVDQDISNRALLEFSVGLKRLRFTPEDRSGFVVDYAEPFIFGGLMPKKTHDNNPEMSLWRFGFGSKDGYAYNFSNSNLAFYIMSKFGWSDVDFSQNRFSAIYDRYSDGLKYGKSTAGGIDYQIGSTVGIGLAYEQSLIFPAYIFPQSFTSSVLQFAMHKLSDKLLDPVLSYNHQFLPILHFLLHNAINFGLYELREENMYWPFKSESPLAIKTIKLNFTLIF